MRNDTNHAPGSLADPSVRLALLFTASQRIAHEALCNAKTVRRPAPVVGAEVICSALQYAKAARS